MARETVIGRYLFAVVFVAFGVLSFIFSRFVVGLEPVPSALVPPMPWAWVNGLVLIGAGLGLLIPRSACAAALLMAVLFLLSTIGFHGPLLIGHLRDDADDALHTLAIAAGALVLAAALESSRGGEGRWDGLLESGGRLGVLCFALCTIGHGVMHFVFFKFTADFIPAWIPGHAFWAAATGVAQIAAGLAILSGVLARLAAILTAIMYGSWVFLVHVPRVIADPSRVEWTSVFIAAALCASALVVAGGEARRRNALATKAPA